MVPRHEASCWRMRGGPCEPVLHPPPLPRLGWDAPPPRHAVLAQAGIPHIGELAAALIWPEDAETTEGRGQSCWVMQRLVVSCFDLDVRLFTSTCICSPRPRVARNGSFLSVQGVPVGEGHKYVLSCAGRPAAAFRDDILLVRQAWGARLALAARPDREPASRRRAHCTAPCRAHGAPGVQRGAARKPTSQPLGTLVAEGRAQDKACHRHWHYLPHYTRAPACPCLRRTTM